MDADADGFVSADVVVPLTGDDCDDADPDVFPQAPDPPGDGLDQDCDGVDG